MERLKSKELEEITLEDFVVLYVDVALKLAEEDVSLDYFDWTLRETISNETPLDYGAIKYLHHSIHSSFFNERSSNSPFKLSNSKKMWQSSIVSLEKRKSFNKQEFVGYILEKHEKSFLERWNTLFMGGFNISPIPYKRKDFKPDLDLATIALEAIEISKKKNQPVVIIGGKSKDVSNLIKCIQESNNSLEVSHEDVRLEFIEGFDYLDSPYFIELDKINLTYKED